MKEKYSWKLSDLIIPTFAVMLAIYYLFTIIGIPVVAQMYGGSLSIGVILLSAAMFLLAVKSGGFKKITNPITYLKENWCTPTIIIYKKVVVLLVFITLYIILIPYMGYPLTSIIFLTIVMHFLGMKNTPKIVGIATLVTFMGFALFILFLNVQLPLDLLTEQIKYFIRDLIDSIIK